MLEDKTLELIPEAFDLLIQGVEEVELSDSLQRTQFQQMKNEVKNLKKLYYKPKSAEFQDTQRWLQYSIAQLSNELPPKVVLRFENLFNLLKN